MIQIKFARRLRELREEHELKKSELARIIHVRPEAISHWEKDYCRTDFETLALLAEIFHTTTDYLIGLTDERGKI